MTNKFFILFTIGIVIASIVMVALVVVVVVVAFPSGQHNLEFLGADNQVTNSIVTCGFVLYTENSIRYKICDIDQYHIYTGKYRLSEVQ